MAEQLLYQIKIRGELDPAWEGFFEGLALTHDCEGNTILTGTIIDQTALHSMLLKIRDLNLRLISVNEIECGSDEFSREYS